MPSIPDTLADHPASDKLVYRVLAEEGPVPRQELAEETYLHIRTITDCLQRLRDAGVVERTPRTDDVRKVVYDVSDRRPLNKAPCRD